MTIKHRAYIAGAYEHPTRKAPDKSVAQLHAECARGALIDAGLTKDDVDGYFCAGDAPGMGPLSMVDYMNLRVRHVDATDIGGSSYLMLVSHAAQAIAAGKCSVALITAQRGYRHRHPAPRRRSRAARRAMGIPLWCDRRQRLRHVRHAPHARIRHHL